MAELELDNVRAGYGETVVLEDLRLTIAPGETVSIIGRNGVGKSTLLLTIMGHTTLHGGRILLKGQDISRIVTYRRVSAGLGLVPQEREIFPSSACARTWTSPRGRDFGRTKRCVSYSRGLRSVPPTAAIEFPAASSRCSRSAAR